MSIVKVSRRLFIGGMMSVAAAKGAQREARECAMVVHGGAGTILREEMTREREQEYRGKLSQALQAGQKILDGGGSSLDAVEAAIVVMEDSPLFNAGKGAVFNSQGEHELDASIMEGAGLKAGAVAGVRKIKNPIRAARAVMEKSPHVLMSGDGAEEFAQEQGIEFVEPDYFFDQKRWEQLQKARGEKRQALDHSLFRDEEKFGTVGAVALDRKGNLAAGTSTGGMTNKKFGRVGDSPIIGAGTYADNRTCAVSCTGHGEYFIRTAAAHEVSALMAHKEWKIQRAVDEVIHKQIGGLGGSGGAIALDARGNVAMSFNTPGMYRGWSKSGREANISLYKEE